MQLFTWHFYYLPNAEIDLRLGQAIFAICLSICLCQLIWKLYIRDAILMSGSPAGVKDIQLLARTCPTFIARVTQLIATWGWGI